MQSKAPDCKSHVVFTTSFLVQIRRALFRITQKWKQSNVQQCPTTGEWIKTVWPVYTMDYYLATYYNIDESQKHYVE